MRDQQNPSAIHIYGPEGEIIPVVFFDAEAPLWNESRTTLTLLVDPARIKTGLLANRNLGYAFRAGCTYTLSIDTAFRSMEGETLSVPFQKQFRAAVACSTRLDENRWTITVPPSGTRQPLRLNFHMALDHLSALAYIAMAESSGKLLPGKTQLSQSDSTWQFFPGTPWQKKTYKLFVNHRLEDPSGNNLDAPFEHLRIPDRQEESKTDILTIQII